MLRAWGSAARVKSLGVRVKDVHSGLTLIKRLEFEGLGCITFTCLCLRHV